MSLFQILTRLGLRKRLDYYYRVQITESCLFEGTWLYPLVYIYIRHLRFEMYESSYVELIVLLGSQLTTYSDLTRFLVSSQDLENR